MRTIDQYSNDLERGPSANSYEFAQSDWSYLNRSAPTEEWIEDIPTGTEQDHMQAYGSISDSLSHQEGITGHDSALYVNPAFLSTDLQLAGDISPAWDSDRGHSAVHDGIWASDVYTSGDAGLSSPSPHHVGTYPTSNEPWNTVGPRRVARYDTGFVAFVDSPNSSSSQSSGDASSGRGYSPQERMIHASQDAIAENLSPRSTGIVNQQQLHWEMISTIKHGPPKYNKITMRETGHSQRKGRHGPLDSQGKKEARVMRKQGVCWPCRISKVKASFFRIPLGQSLY
jgi:hypothetical protein